MYKDLPDDCDERSQLTCGTSRKTGMRTEPNLRSASEEGGSKNVLGAADASDNQYEVNHTSEHAHRTVCTPVQNDEDSTFAARCTEAMAQARRDVDSAPVIPSFLGDAPSNKALAWFRDGHTLPRIHCQPKTGSNGVKTPVLCLEQRQPLTAKFHLKTTDSNVGSVHPSHRVDQEQAMASHSDIRSNTSHPNHTISNTNSNDIECKVSYKRKKSDDTDLKFIKNCAEPELHAHNTRSLI